MRAAPHNLVKLRCVSTTPRIALVAGANGLVGSCLLQVLIEAPEYTRVYALTRRPLGREHSKLANRIVAFSRLAEQLKGLSAQDAYCCIGTTIRDAGSEDAFRDADVEAVLRFAEAARAAGATRFAVVSSVGAAVASKKFYLRCKGEMEEGVTRLGFPAVDIFQPSLLLGPRKQARPLETLGKLLAPAVNPLLTGARESWRAACWARPAAAGVASIGTPMRRSANSPKSNPCWRQRRNPPKRAPPDCGAAATVTRRAFTARSIP